MGLKILWIGLILSTCVVVAVDEYGKQNPTFAVKWSDEKTLIGVGQIKAVEYTNTANITFITTEEIGSYVIEGIQDIRIGDNVRIFEHKETMYVCFDYKVTCSGLALSLNY